MNAVQLGQIVVRDVSETTLRTAFPDCEIAAVGADLQITFELRDQSETYPLLDRVRQTSGRGGQPPYAHARVSQLLRWPSQSSGGVSRTVRMVRQPPSSLGLSPWDPGWLKITLDELFDSMRRCLTSKRPMGSALHRLHRRRRLASLLEIGRRLLPRSLP
jgi:hypothetical protein